jgi:hypothetical protein
MPQPCTLRQAVKTRLPTTVNRHCCLDATNSLTYMTPAGRWAIYNTNTKMSSVANLVACCLAAAVRGMAARLLL